MLYFDTHAHYDWKEFEEDRAELFENFKSKLCAIVNVGMNPESLDKVIEYSEKYNFMYFSAGVHPMEVEKNIDIGFIERKAIELPKNNKLVAIGETGLDYHFDYPKDLQKKYFIDQIKIANKLELPIIIHAREAHDDVYKILESNLVKKGGIMHCYSGKPDMAKSFVDLGFYLGIGGPVTRYEDIQETVRITPLENLVIETDAPVLPPKPFEKTERNTSLYLEYVVNKIAEIKGISAEDVIRATTENACKIYNLEF